MLDPTEPPPDEQDQPSPALGSGEEMSQPLQEHVLSQRSATGWRRQQSTSRLVPLLAVIVLLVLAGAFFVEPAIKLLGEPPRRPSFRPIELGAWEKFQHGLVAGLTTLWFFMLGASFGSFLHCVEYRLPRRISVVARGSSCPGCGKAIRLWHNVPVLGWLWLGGRCAACGWPIPIRYALTELVFGLVFVLLMAVEIAGGGLNIPGAQAKGMLGLVENLWDPDWRLIALFGYHAALFCFLLTWCLYAWDRLRLSSVLAAIALGIGIAGPIALSELHPVRWNGGLAENAADPLRGHTLFGLAAGGLVGLLIGAAIRRRVPGNVRFGDSVTALHGMLLVGLYLGWQAAVSVAVLAVAIRAVLLLIGGRRWPLVVSITLAALIHFVLWRWLAAQSWWPGPQAAWLVAAGYILACAAAASLLDIVERGGDAGPARVEREKPLVAPPLQATADLESRSAAEPPSAQISGP